VAKGRGHRLKPIAKADQAFACGTPCFGVVVDPENNTIRRRALKDRFGVSTPAESSVYNKRTGL
jgi:hypothetical protein